MQHSSNSTDDVNEKTDKKEARYKSKSQSQKFFIPKPARTDSNQKQQGKKATRVFDMERCCRDLEERQLQAGIAWVICNPMARDVRSLDAGRRRSRENVTNSQFIEEVARIAAANQPRHRAAAAAHHTKSIGVRQRSSCGRASQPSKKNAAVAAAQKFSSVSNIHSADLIGNKNGFVSCDDSGASDRFARGSNGEIGGGGDDRSQTLPLDAVPIQSVIWLFAQPNFCTTVRQVHQPPEISSSPIRTADVEKRPIRLSGAQISDSKASINSREFLLKSALQRKLAYDARMATRTSKSNNRSKTASAANKPIEKHALPIARKVDSQLNMLEPQQQPVVSSCETLYPRSSVSCPVKKSITSLLCSTADQSEKTSNSVSGLTQTAADNSNSKEVKQPTAAPSTPSTQTASESI